MLGRTSIIGLAAAALVAGLAGSSSALPIAPLGSAQIDNTGDIIQVAQKKGGGGGKAAKSSKGGGGKAVKSSKASKTVKASSAKKAVTKKTVVRRNVTVHRTTVVRPYRVWVHRPYYGAVIAGVTLGTIVAVSAAHVVPVAPAPNLCWFWSDPAEINGYWDYCTPPL